MPFKNKFLDNKDISLGAEVEVGKFIKVVGTSFGHKHGINAELKYLNSLRYTRFWVYEQLNAQKAWLDSAAIILFWFCIHFQLGVSL